MPDTPETIYIDTGWIGAPAAMAAALTALGWEPTPSETPPPMHPSVRGFTPVMRTQIAGQDQWVVHIRSVEALVLPDGVSLAPEWLTSAAVGGFGGLAPRTITAMAFLERFTASEQAALYAADARLIAGAIKVSTQGAANLDSQDAHNLMALAVAKGVLTAERAAEILA